MLELMHSHLISILSHSQFTNREIIRFLQSQLLTIYIQNA